MRIVSFGQVVEIGNGRPEIAHQLTIEMGDGKRVAVPTDEKTVNTLLMLVSGDIPRKEPLPSPSSLFSQASGPSDSEVLEGEVFGDDPGEMLQEPVMGKIAEEEVRVSAAPAGLGSGQVVRPRVDKDGFALPIPSRTVEKDEMGYPVVPGQRSAPRSEDDDGTQL